MKQPIPVFTPIFS
ncbi:hypothetical protein CGLO_08090 [Colletotrichum gloeosporioides Cg-14]|uniref:Uncharacterized protein n=1 Tax=Colletotrichum gloeosporioides (strain Cg-14) TaxID=1237896 RepID=T0KH81_COLGC|nr:hypothetical protein CGLO_08090 [Colletotrichum gloeosporioides Cg-14]